jgi:putative aldouronate transport system permease protein
MGLMKNLKRESAGYHIFIVCNSIIMLFVVFVTLYPFLYVVAQSFSSSGAIYAGKVTFFPVEPNLLSYKAIVKNPLFYTAYRNTIIYVLLGTSISLALSCMLAYPLSKPKIKIQKFLTPFIVFTMFFVPGMIPNYILVSSLNLRNTIWAVVLPNAIHTYYVLIMRSFFNSLPVELEEAAVMDGLNIYGIFFRIVLPLSAPIISTMVLFYGVDMWNQWFNAFVYMDRRELFPVSLYLRGLIMAVAGAREAGAESFSDNAQIETTVRSCAIVLTSLPIMCIYPFIQKYFVKGVMIGSVKG